MHEGTVWEVGMPWEPSTNRNRFTKPPPGCPQNHQAFLEVYISNQYRAQPFMWIYMMENTAKICKHG